VNLAEVYGAEKTILGDVRWKRNAGDATFLATLEIGGVTREGLFLRGSAKIFRPYEAVMLQLEAHIAGRRSGGQMERLCWRPLIGHTNPNTGPHEVSALEMEGSHFHDFSLNYSVATNEMSRGNLKLARLIEPEPNDFKEFLDFCAARLNIVNLGTLPEPPWEPDLFGDTT
jgi:hypothetical protein